MKPHALLIVSLLAGLLAVGTAAEGDAWRSPGKRMAAVDIDGRGVHQAAVGQGVSVPLVLKLGAPADRVRVELTTTDGLLLDTTHRVRETEALGARQVEFEPVRVTPQSDGRHYLGVTVFLVRGQAQRFRSFAIPVESGDATRRPATKRSPVATDASGRRVHVLPARTTR